MWREWREHLASDGALRDIRVVGATTREDWDRLLEALVNGPYVVTVDGAPDGSRFDIDKYAALASDRARCIHITAGPGRLLINCHLWDESLIDFDIDPKEVRFQQDADTVLEFMEWIGRELRRDIVLVDEGAAEHVLGYVRYRYTDRRLEFPGEA